jgi:multidrug efflux system outer membrane protein
LLFCSWGWSSPAAVSSCAARRKCQQIRLVASLKEYTTLAKLLFDGGYTDYTTVLQAEQALFPAELNLAGVRAQVFASAVNIYKAMGGGWVSRADALTAPRPALPGNDSPPQPLF